MAATFPIPLYRSCDELRERLTEMRDDLVDRMLRRGNPEPAHLPMLAGIEATLRMLAGEEIAAPDYRPPEPAPQDLAMATADPDGEHVRLDIEVSGSRASLRLDPLLALRLGGSSEGGFGASFIFTLHPYYSGKLARCGCLDFIGY